MLCIDYLDDSQSAYLSMGEESLAWGEIQRVCQERGEISIINDKSISVPWWLFLSARKSIRLIAVKYQLKISFSPKVKELLTLANANRSQFKNVRLANPIPEQDITNKLREVGFER